MTDDDSLASETEERERVARLVDHMLRTAKPGTELHYEVAYGPETEDTTSWLKTGDGIEVWQDSVYPAMHALPSKLLRTFTAAEARAELIRVIDASRRAWTKRGDTTFMADREKVWSMT